MRNLVYTEDKDTEHVIDLSRVLITSIDGEHHKIILTLVGGITVHIKAKDRDTFTKLYKDLAFGTDNLQISYEEVDVRLGGLKLG
jgi:hypothetical protein